MDAKFQIRKISLAITLVGIFLFTGCVGSSSLSTNKDGALPSVPGPESGRDSALNYVRDHHNIDLPFGTESWKGKNITPDGVTTSAAYEFSNAEWLVSVVYRVVEPAQRIYRVVISNHVDFSWEGQVDAFGQVAESLVDYSPSADQATSTPLPTVDQPLVISPTPASASTVYLKQFRDETYLLGFEYPSSWSLTTTPAGRNTGVSFAAKTITLNRDGVNITLQYKFMWERTSVSGLLPPGDIEIRRRVKILDLEIPVKYVVENGVDKYIFFGGSKDELEFGISIDAEGEGIPADIQGEADTIFASIVRTGDPLPTPTLAPTPLPTSAIAATRSGSGSGSVVTEDCNKASFVAHVTIPEGSLLLPGVQFTKVWRIQNVGTCTWTTAYHLVFSTGDLMGADKSVALPEDVPPGSSVDISVDFTTPEKTGDYQGYWILNDSQGFWFGLGEQKNGFIPIDIVVIQPNENLAYDFGIHYCDAIWKNKNHEGDEELPCPGSSPSTEGFVILVVNPQLENRSENELALWVHPNEERYGWIKGTYPAYQVKNGDRFRTWVSCKAELNLCSIKFILDYKDADGDVHNLGSWIETYDGKVTKIDLDLSTLAGQSVRFILKTEALTKNVTAAQGYWFVPRIEHP